NVFAQHLDLVVGEAQDSREFTPEGMWSLSRSPNGKVAKSVPARNATVGLHASMSLMGRFESILDDEVGLLETFLDIAPLTVEMGSHVSLRVIMYLRSARLHGFAWIKYRR